MSASHLITDHMQFSVTCHADGCNAKVQSNVLQEHLLSNHGKVECRGCGFVLGILNARDHFDEESECLKNKKVQSLTQLYSLHNSPIFDEYQTQSA